MANEGLRKVLVIANPIAGGGRGVETARALEGELGRYGVAAEVFVTRQRGDAEAAAGRGGFDGVVSVGGDGSASEAANGLAGRDVPLAIQPLGTANVLASELGLPRDPAKLAPIVARGRTLLVDRGLANGRCFVMGCGAGADAAVTAAVHRHRGKRLGLLGWIGPALRTALTYRWPTFQVEVDGELVCADACYVVIGNCRYSAGLFAFTPEAKLDDGLLDVCVFRKVGAVRLFLLALLTYLPHFARRRAIRYRQGRFIRVTAAPGAMPAPVQIDGDPAGELPLTVEVVPRSLRLIVP